jgi:hypothetical protein
LRILSSRADAAGGLRVARSVQRHSGADESLERLLVDLVAFVKVDRAPDVPVETRVENPEGSSSEAPLAKVIFTTFL